MKYRAPIAEELAEAGVLGVAAKLGQVNPEAFGERVEALFDRLNEALPEVTIEGYAVKPEGIYNARGERIGNPLFVTGDGPGAPTALISGLPVGTMHVVIQDKPDEAIMVALAWMGYEAEPGKGLEVADYIRRSWGGGTGPHSMLVDGVNLPDVISDGLDLFFGAAAGRA